MKNNSTNFLDLLKPSYLCTGRMNRSSFLVAFVIGLMSLFILLLEVNIFAKVNEVFYVLVLPVLYFAVISIFQIPIRRLHDLGYSGWYILIGYIPYVGLILWLFLLLKKGDSGENEFGLPIKKSANPIDIFFNTEGFSKRKDVQIFASCLLAGVILSIAILAVNHPISNENDDKKPANNFPPTSENLNSQQNKIKPTFNIDDVINGTN